LKSPKDISLTLSAVRALLRNVTPPLHSASVEWKENTIVWKCVFDTKATADDYELMSIAAAEIISDFPDAELEEIFLTVAPTESVEPLEHLICHRHEQKWQ
jgi:hypothetical protein